MSKKKLAFYDAFKQKNKERSDAVVDPSTTTNIAGHTSFTPGEELKLRPQPKHMPTARHNVNLNPTEIRAKGSSIPPGAAERWQTPNVNKDYIKRESDTLPKTNFRQQESTVNPVAEGSQQFNAAPVNVPPAALNIKPVSFQSETLPYLDSNDLETQSLPVNKSATDTSFNKLDNIKGQIILSPAHGLSILAIFTVGLCLSFYLGMSFQGKSSSESNRSIDPDLTLSENSIEKARTRRSLIDKPVSTKPISGSKSRRIDLTPTKRPKSVDKGRYKYTIRAITIPSRKKAQSIKVLLEKDGFGPVKFEKKSRGYLISVGAFRTATEANKVVARLRKKKVRHSMPFKTAYKVKIK